MINRLYKILIVAMFFFAICKHFIMQYYSVLPTNGIQTNTANINVGPLGSIQPPSSFTASLSSRPRQLTALYRFLISVNTTLFVNYSVSLEQVNSNKCFEF